jgi:hypothetical protein
VWRGRRKIKKEMKELICKAKKIWEIGKEGNTAGRKVGRRNRKNKNLMCTCGNEI